eukprot:gnl/MRDRNA2_/MRDRNA2_351555_c0_seq1.p1 gnl/MRDRNA2_/MRDRNA2_351555_c0~~gnl/MRDRNA2_/MRDRNA2_351555_c0_seq1.p1  ORF type:complete len:174 (+),score=28.80 gnl/MRDRNA2_/MRDRNA2_351555_c0_seq1:79-522(+)
MPEPDTVPFVTGKAELQASGTAGLGIVNPPRVVKGKPVDAAVQVDLDELRQSGTVKASSKVNKATSGGSGQFQPLPRPSPRSSPRGNRAPDFPGNSAPALPSKPAQKEENIVSPDLQAPQPAIPIRSEDTAKPREEACGNRQCGIWK